MNCRNLLLDVLSPCCGLELVEQREEALINVDLEYCVEVVCCDHLTCEADDDNELLIVEELSELVEKFIRYCCRVLYILLSEFGKDCLLLIVNEVSRIEAQALNVTDEEE